MIQRLLLLSVVFFWLSSSSYSQEYTYDGNLTQQDIDQSVLYGAPSDPALLDENKTYMDQIIVPNDYQATTGCLLVQQRTWNGTTGGQCANGIDGTYTFGYSQTVIAQTQNAIAEALKIADITVVGYRWQWRVKNADTNYVEEQSAAQGGTADPLIITVTVKDKQGNVLDEREWDYSYYIYDWEQKYGMHWYDPFITGDKIDTITLEVEAYDKGYWAGYYGPEFGSAGIYSIMVYDPDPCEQIPVVDPTCPGFIGEAPAEDPAVQQLVIIESTGSIPLSEDELAVLESLEEPVQEIVELENDTSDQSGMQEEEKSVSSVDALSVAQSAEANALADAAAIVDNTLSATALAAQSDVQTSQQTSQQSQTQSQQSMQEAQQSVQQSVQSSGIESTSADGNVSVSNIIAQSQAQSFKDNQINIEITIDSFKIAALDNAINDAVANLIKLEQNVIREQVEESQQEEELAEPISNEQEDELVEKALSGDDSEDAQAALLGYNPNFRAYQQPQMADAEFYQPKDIYAGQENYDNPNARFFNGASDATHRQMVRQQYERN